MKKIIKGWIKNFLIYMGMWRGIRYITTIIRRRNLKVLFKNLKYRKRYSIYNLPVPPDNLIFLVTGGYDVQWFIESGRMTTDRIVDTLKKNKVNIDKFGSILDFGCGCGRIIQHWHSLFPDMEIYGTDKNPDLIIWCKKHLTFAHFSTNKEQERLRYADGKFDFMYAISVFTHLKEGAQFFWLEELSRVLKPGGFFLITTHGQSYLPQMTLEERDKFLQNRLVVREENIMGSKICSAFHPVEYVYKKFTKGALRLIDFTPGSPPNQDIFLFQKLSRDI